GLKRHFVARADVAAALPDIEASVLDNRLTPTEGARRLLALLDNPRQPQAEVSATAGAAAHGDAAPVQRRHRRR
ncbi:MAG: hypothetical protein ABI629_15215, partial [bacterium]